MAVNNDCSDIPSIKSGNIVRFKPKATKYPLPTLVIVSIVESLLVCFMSYPYHTLLYTYNIQLFYCITNKE